MECTSCGCECETLLLLVLETNIYLPDRIHFSCSLSSGKKTTTSGSVLKSVVGASLSDEITSELPWQAGEEAVRKRVSYVTVSLGQELPLLCVSAMGHLFLTCSFYNTHK